MATKKLFLLFGVSWKTITVIYAQATFVKPTSKAVPAQIILLCLKIVNIRLTSDHKFVRFSSVENKQTV